jgi:hypothetical protein
MPEPTRTQRLAAVMRVIGHPLSFMRKWPEAAGVGTEAPERKTQDMAEQKALAAHRAAIEKSVVKLSERRDLLRAELDEVEAELKSLLSMLKAAGLPADAPLEAMEKEIAKGKKVKLGKPTKAERAAQNEGPMSIALKLASKGTVTPVSLATSTGQQTIDASNLLGRLARQGKLKRVSRGVYGAA